MLISRNLLSILAGCLLAVLAPAAASAQTPTNDRPSPVAYASVSELNNILAQVRDVAQSIDGDLAKTRIDRWKADAATKRDAQANVESIRRNVKSALPEILTQLNNAPKILRPASSSIAIWTRFMTSLARWRNRPARSDRKMSIRTWATT